jgi:type I restriction enzyme S subunit
MDERLELPLGWEQVTLGELNAYKSHAANPQEAPEETFELYSVPAFPSRLPDLVMGSEIGSTKQVVEFNDVLICKINPRINRVWNVGSKSVYPQIASSEWIVVRSPELDSTYLRHLFSTPFFREILCEGVTGVGGSLTRAQPKRVREFVIPLAPLIEQRRIAAKLDTTLAAVDACRQRLDRLEALLKRFRQAVLAAATSGELTREWRGERGEDFDWLDVQLGEYAESMNYGTSTKSQSEGEVPVLRMGNLQGGELDWTELVYTSDLAEIAKYMLDEGDVLFNRTNSPELVGKTAIYRGERPAIYAGYLIRVRCRPSLDPEFLNLSLNSHNARDYCWRVKSDGVSQSNINSKKLAAYPFLLPPVHEQQEIVRRAQQLFSFADQLEAKLTSARQIVERLTPALLAKAFRGELVPQDPNDEPASVLLERIRAARQADAAAGKPSRRRRPRAAANPVGSVTVAAPVTPDLLASLLRECGALSERALLAASELDHRSFDLQLEAELKQGRVRRVDDDGQVLVEAAD